MKRQSKLEKRVAELEAKVKVLEARTPIEYHFHYSQPTYTPLTLPNTTWAVHTDGCITDATNIPNTFTTYGPFACYSGTVS